MAQADAGNTLLREIRNNTKLAYRVCGFIDDDPGKTGLHLAGVRVFGGGGTIGALVARHRISVILIAIPSATGAEMTRILGLCHNAEVEFKTVPGLGEAMEARSLAGQIREVALEDLLGRTSRTPRRRFDTGHVAGQNCPRYRCGRSIGFELCRQIARFILLESLDLRSQNPRCSKSNTNASVLSSCSHFILRLKHSESRSPERNLSALQAGGGVPSRRVQTCSVDERLMYLRPSKNNIFGSYNVAVAASDHGAEDFLLIFFRQGGSGRQT
ncbi:MAG: hypothetical protein WDM87_08915 [Terracidiphilus sp.]